MNTSVTSRDAILSVSRQFITQNGFGSVNMRAIAAACGVSVGSVYNYFPSKGDLICAVVESVWHDIFHLSGNPASFPALPTASNGCLTASVRAARSILPFSPCTR